MGPGRHKGGGQSWARGRDDPLWILSSHGFSFSLPWVSHFGVPLVARLRGLPQRAVAGLKEGLRRVGPPRLSAFLPRCLRGSFPVPLLGACLELGEQSDDVREFEGALLLGEGAQVVHVLPREAAGVLVRAMEWMALGHFEAFSSGSEGAQYSTQSWGVISRPVKGHLLSPWRM